MMTSAEAFDVVFTIADAGTPDVYASVFFLGLPTLVTAILYLTRTRGWQFGLVLLGLFAFVDVVFVWLPYLTASRTMTANGCEWVTGTVEDYSLQPYTGHAPGDRFRVAGHWFEMSNFVIGPGYRRTVAYGGIHLAGRYVRLCRVGDAITQLEVRRQPWPRDMSRVSFRVKGKDALDFSLALYGVTQKTLVRSFPAIWAKDFALSDFEVAIAGPCDGAVAALGTLVDAASAGLAARQEIVATYRTTAKCAASTVPPLRSWKPAPKVRLGGSDGVWTYSVWE